MHCFILRPACCRASHNETPPTVARTLNILAVVFCVSICRPSTRKYKDGEAQETLEGFICSSCYYSSMVEKIWRFSCDIFPSTSYQHTLLVLSCRRVDCTDTIITVNVRWPQAPVLPQHLQPHLSQRRIVSPLKKLPLPTSFVCFRIRQQSLHTDCVRIHSIVRKTSFCIPTLSRACPSPGVFPFEVFTPFSRANQISNYRH